jgi:hypothetical protein
MSDALPDDALPAWAAELLGRPVPLPPDDAARARARVMAAVRRAPRHGRPLARAYRLGAAAPRWARRRGLLAPTGALAAALVAAALAAGARLAPAAGPLDAALTATVLGDTVLGGTALGDAVRDTLRVVRFALAGPAGRAATGVTLAGDFTGWRPGAPLARGRRGGAWSVTLAVPRDAVRYAFVVDGAGGRRWVAAPPLPAAAAPRSLDSAAAGGPT